MLYPSQLAFSDKSRLWAARATRASQPQSERTDQVRRPAREGNQSTRIDTDGSTQRVSVNDLSKASRCNAGRDERCYSLCLTYDLSSVQSAAIPVIDHPECEATPSHAIEELRHSIRSSFTPALKEYYRNLMQALSEKTINHILSEDLNDELRQLAAIDEVAMTYAGTTFDTLPTELSVLLSELVEPHAREYWKEFKVANSRGGVDHGEYTETVEERARDWAQIRLVKRIW
jgi:hypothetical protein